MPNTKTDSPERLRILAELEKEFGSAAESFGISEHFAAPPGLIKNAVRYVREWQRLFERVGRRPQIGDEIPDTETWGATQALARAIETAVVLLIREIERVGLDGSSLEELGRLCREQVEAGTARRGSRKHLPMDYRESMRKAEAVLRRFDAKLSVANTCPATPPVEVCERNNGNGATAIDTPELAADERSHDSTDGRPGGNGNGRAATGEPEPAATKPARRKRTKEGPSEEIIMLGKASKLAKMFRDRFANDDGKSLTAMLRNVEVPSHDTFKRSPRFQGARDEWKNLKEARELGAALAKHAQDPPSERRRSRREERVECPSCKDKHDYRCNKCEHDDSLCGDCHAEKKHDEMV